MAKVAGPLVKKIIIKLVKTPYILYGTYRGIKSKNLQTATFVTVDFSICVASVLVFSVSACTQVLCVCLYFV